MLSVCFFAAQGLPRLGTCWRVLIVSVSPTRDSLQHHNLTHLLSWTKSPFFLLKHTVLSWPLLSVHKLRSNLAKPQCSAPYLSYILFSVCPHLCPSHCCLWSGCGLLRVTATSSALIWQSKSPYFLWSLAPSQPFLALAVNLDTFYPLFKCHMIPWPYYLSMSFFFTYFHSLNFIRKISAEFVSVFISSFLDDCWSWC